MQSRPWEKKWRTFHARQEQGLLYVPIDLEFCGIAREMSREKVKRGVQVEQERKKNCRSASRVSATCVGTTRGTDKTTVITHQLMKYVSRTYVGKMRACGTHGSRVGFSITRTDSSTVQSCTFIYIPQKII